MLKYFYTTSLVIFSKTIYYSLAWCSNTNNYKPAYNELGHAYRQLKAYEEYVNQFKKKLAIL
jgi:hypothetical protein